MQVAEEESNSKFTLFRGDYSEKKNEIERFGIQAEKRWSESGLPHQDWLNLTKSLPEALPFTAKEQIIKHVLKPEGWRSPFVSFTRKKDAARQYAFGREKRKEGLLITTTISAVKKYYLQFESFGESVILLDKPAILLDNLGRRWIHLRNVPFSIAGNMARGMEDFYNNINQDDEFLLLGDLRPGEFTGINFKLF
ncbi:MAG: hypothetical protein AB1711_06315 [Thermodesulfobacteriota bacterium]